MGTGHDFSDLPYRVMPLGLTLFDIVEKTMEELRVFLRNRICRKLILPVNFDDLRYSTTKLILFS